MIEYTKEYLYNVVVHRDPRYTSLRWSLRHAPTGDKVRGPDAVFDHPDLGPTITRGAVRWQTKREALAALDALRAEAQTKVAA
jgi:hypothetical protein